MVDVIVLGLDALDSRYLDTYVEAGRLPTFEARARESELETKPIDSFHTDNLTMPMTIQAWTCLYTGTDTDYHGAEEGDWRKCNFDFEADVPSTVFDDVSSAGLLAHSWRMAMTWPARDISGWMLSGFPSGQDEGVADSEVWGLDPALLPEGYGKIQDRWVAQNTEGIEPYLRAEDRKFEICADLVDATTDPDVLFWGTQLLDKIGHELTEWKEEQETNIYDHSYMHRAYAKVDELLGAFIETYDPSLIVGVSDHGFCRDYGAHSMHSTLFEWVNPDADIAEAGAQFDGVESILDFRDYFCARLGIPRQPPESRFSGSGGDVDEISESERDRARERLAELGYL